MIRDGMVLKGDTWFFYLEGKLVTEAEYEKVYPPIVHTDPPQKQGRCTTWPMVSKLACGIHPDQVEEANARNKAHGVAAEYDNEGNCHIPSEQDYKKLRRLLSQAAGCEVFDRDSYYG